MFIKKIIILWPVSHEWSMEMWFLLNSNYTDFSSKWNYGTGEALGEVVLVKKKKKNSPALIIACQRVNAETLG